MDAGDITELPAYARDAALRGQLSNLTKQIDVLEAKIIAELIVTKHSERQLRVIDHDQDGSMEVKKREGYF